MTRFWNIWGVNPFLLWYALAKSILRPRRIPTDTAIAARGYGASWEQTVRGGD